MKMREPFTVELSEENYDGRNEAIRLMMSMILEYSSASVRLGI